MKGENVRKLKNIFEKNEVKIEAEETPNKNPRRPPKSKRGGGRNRGTKLVAENDRTQRKLLDFWESKKKKEPRDKSDEF